MRIVEDQDRLRMEMVSRNPTSLHEKSSHLQDQTILPPLKSVFSHVIPPLDILGTHEMYRKPIRYHFITAGILF